MSDLSLTLTGGADVSAACRSVAQVLQDGTLDQLAAELLAPRVRDAAPVRTGRLRDSVAAQPSSVTIAAPYAAMVNARTHFVQSAAEQAAERIPEQAAATVVAAFDR